MKKQLRKRKKKLKSYKQTNSMVPNKGEKMNSIGIYVHIPFCQKKCKYCDFISFDQWDENIKKRYIQAIFQEIEHCKIDSQVSTIYIGGGTPSVLAAEEISKILEKIKQKFIVKENAEITMEVNPGTVDLAKLEHYKAIGINRLSIGLQSTKNRLLQLLGRIHTKEEFKEVYENARKVRF